MTWIDNNGEVRPQSWEEYLSMEKQSSAQKPCPCAICERIRKRERQKSGFTKTQRVRSKAERLPRMRIRLFRADPHCFWCGVEVHLSGTALATFATVDHLYSRWHPERRTRHVEGNGVLHVLACHDCNQERAGAEVQMKPFIPKLKERLEFAQRADATLAKQNFQPAPVVVARPVAMKHSEAKVRTLNEEFLQETRKVLSMRVICTLEEAIEYARENPGR